MRVPARQPGYRVFGTPADIGVHARGRTAARLFENAALGMFAVIGQPQEGAPLRETSLRLCAESLDMLLYAWLSELLYRYDARGCFGRRFKNTTVVDNSIRSTLLWQPAAAVRVRREIKAVTLHKLLIRRAGGLWRASIIFDL